MLLTALTSWSLDTRGSQCLFWGTK